MITCISLYSDLLNKPFQETLKLFTKVAKWSVFLAINNLILAINIKKMHFNKQEFPVVL